MTTQTTSLRSLEDVAVAALRDMTQEPSRTKVAEYIAALASDLVEAVKENDHGGAQNTIEAINQMGGQLYQAINRAWR